jgi:hypothetical protein
MREEGEKEKRGDREGGRIWVPPPLKAQVNINESIGSVW